MNHVKLLRLAQANPQEMRLPLPDARVNSWDNCKDAGWKTRAFFGFGESAHDNCASFGHLVEISEELDLIVIVAQNVSLE